MPVLSRPSATARSKNSRAGAITKSPGWAVVFTTGYGNGISPGLSAGRVFWATSSVATIASRTARIATFLVIFLLLSVANRRGAIAAFR